MPTVLHCRVAALSSALGVEAAGSHSAAGSAAQGEGRLAPDAAPGQPPEKKARVGAAVQELEMRARMRPMGTPHLVCLCCDLNN